MERHRRSGSATGPVYASAVASLCLALGLVALPSRSQAQTPELVGPEVCGGFPQADNGPFDYRVVQDLRLKRVEQFHFTPNVQALTHGQSSAMVGTDLGFVLRAFPNHHRALLTLIQLGEKLNTRQPPGSVFSIGCWLERATRFASDDAVARMIRAQYLIKQGDLGGAQEQVDSAVAQAQDNPLTHYNAGLLYLDMKAYDKAMAQAQLVYGMGMQRPELRERLRQAGRWQDAATSSMDGAASAPGASPAASAAPSR